MNYTSIVSAQRAFFQSGETHSYEFRKAQLETLYAAVVENEKLLIEALYKDLHKSEFEAFSTEIGIILHEISHTLKHLQKWMKPKKVATSTTHVGSKSKIYREPYGVNLIIAPWNYPIQLALLPLIGAIAGGNTAVVKPSEFAVHSSQAICKILTEKFPTEYIACIEGGVEDAQALLAERFDHIFFTGSTNVGRIVMREASEFLTPVTLELGGKSPAIVTASSNLKLAAKRIAWGKFLNAGQTCIAPDYVYVHHAIEEKFVRLLQQEIVSLYSSNPLKSDDYTHIINEKHFDRLLHMLEDADAFYGGEYDRETLAVEPTILVNVSWSDPVMKEEIFGPILPILPYETLDEVVEQINSQPKPLALYLFTEEEALKKRIVSQIPFGGGCINDVLFHITTPNLPFGGVGSSGHGSYHGVHSFKCFTHEKAVLSQTTKFDLNVRYHTSMGSLNIIRKLLK